MKMLIVVNQTDNQNITVSKVGNIVRLSNGQSHHTEFDRVEVKKLYNWLRDYLAETR